MKGETLDNQLESQYIKFSHEIKKLSGGLSFVQISIINNDSINNILTEFIEKLSGVGGNFMIIITFGTIGIFILIFVLLLLYIRSISCN